MNQGKNALFFTQAPYNPSRVWVMNHRNLLADVDAVILQGNETTDRLVECTVPSDQGYKYLYRTPVFEEKDHRPLVRTLMSALELAFENDCRNFAILDEYTVEDAPILVFFAATLWVAKHKDQAMKVYLHCWNDDCKFVEYQKMKEREKEILSKRRA